MAGIKGRSGPQKGDKDLRLSPREAERTKTKIETTKIVNRLSLFINGKIEMSASQVTAALGLLKKVMPDLSSTDVKGDIFNHHFVVSGEPVSEDEWAKQYSDSLGTTEGPAESLN